MRPLLDLCEGAKQIEGARVTLRWWDQPGIDWEKAKAKEIETELHQTRIWGQTRRGGRGGTQKAGQAALVGQNGAERVRMHGHEGNLDHILHRTESSD